MLKSFKPDCARADNLRAVTPIYSADLSPNVYGVSARNHTLFLAQNPNLCSGSSGLSIVLSHKVFSFQFICKVDFFFNLFSFLIRHLLPKN